jgi:hypothetical protein
VPYYSQLHVLSSDGTMASRDDQERYPSIDFENILGYPHEFFVWGNHLMFKGYVFIHIIEFLEYLWEMELQLEDI